MDFITSVLSFIHDFLVGWYKLFWYWPIGTIVGSVFVLLAAMGIWLLWILFSDVGDSSFLKKKHGVGHVVARKFVPAHWESGVTYNVALKMPMSTSSLASDDWRLIIEVNGEVGYWSVTEESYARTKTGTALNVEYTKSRFTKAITFTQVNQLRS